MWRTLKTAALWSAAATVTRLTCGFLSIKVTAIYLGPAGLALVGQLGNFITLLQSTLGNAVNSAVVKMTAEAGDQEPERVQAIVGTAFRLVVGISLVVTTAIVFGRRLLAEWLLDDEQFVPVLVLTAILFPAVMLAQLQVSVFTAHRRFGLVSMTNIIATAGTALIFVGLSWLFGLWGGLIGIVLTYSCRLLPAMWLGRREAATRLLTGWSDAQRSYVRPIVSFYPMLLANSASVPLGLLLVRDLLIGNFGTAQAGLWQATIRLSDMYTMVFLVALSMYALPTLSAARKDSEFRLALRQLLVACVGGVACAASLLFILREFIVRIVFTPEFARVSDLWPWQLLGDIFFIGSWPMRSALMARGRQTAYMAIEISTGIGLFAVTKLMIGPFGIAAANVAHALVWGSIFGSLLVLHGRLLFGSTAGAE